MAKPDSVDTALEQALQRLAVLADASSAMAGTLDLREALRRLCGVVLPRLGDWCAIDLLRDQNTVQRVVVAHHDERELPTGRLEGTLPPAPEESDDPLARVLRGVGPLLLDEDALREGGEDAFHSAQRELFDRLSAHSVIIAPLRTRRQVVGALTLARGAWRTPLDDEDVALLEELAHRTALAVDNSHLFASVQHVAERLQRSLLPPLPVSAPYEVTARYVPAPTAAEVGGDWYDYFPLPDRASALIIGDVIGHDVQAAVSMSQLRNMLRALACDRREPPSEIMHRLDLITEALYPTYMASCIYARLESTATNHWRLHFSNAGHPPPLLVEHDGDTRYLDDSHGLLLGVDTTQERPDCEALLPPAATLLLYTDGLIERPGESVGQRLRRLREGAAALAREPLDAFCDEVLADFGSGSSDDIALLAVRLPN
ncbi:GAF domain-containing SpoIIE family protein phosphatase [Streptomyces sp. NPDC050423]|uniref:PP2C family protein-serine/threonine phosphatase n=1 Tax=Streptomyces sp. NPDC050423 TaxID=3155402 RepID=UPI00341EE5ED